MTGRTKLLIYQRGEHSYAILYDNDDHKTALKHIGYWACNSDLDFTWGDAARMAYRVKQLARSGVQL